MSYELTVERVFEASAEEVFEAFTNADAQRVWMRDADDPNGILDNPRTTITRTPPTTTSTTASRPWPA